MEPRLDAHLAALLQTELAAGARTGGLRRARRWPALVTTYRDAGRRAPEGR